MMSLQITTKSHKSTTIVRLNDPTRLTWEMWVDELNLIPHRHCCQPLSIFAWSRSDALKKCQKRSLSRQRLLSVMKICSRERTHFQIHSKDIVCENKLFRRNFVVCHLNPGSGVQREGYIDPLSWLFGQTNALVSNTNFHRRMVSVYLANAQATQIERNFTHRFRATLACPNMPNDYHDW